MTIHDIQTLTGARLLTPGVDTAREVTAGYSCDLLSWVMAHGAAGMVWMTIQTHMNVVAVATLMDMAAILLPEDVMMEEAVLKKAEEEGVAVLAAGKTAYALAGMLYTAGLMGG